MAADTNAEQASLDRGPILRRLRAFMAVVRCGSVAAAARQLGVASSSVTRAVRALESDLRGALFERGSRDLLPSAVGLRLLAQADSMYHCLEEAEIALRRVGAQPDGLADKVAVRHFRALVAVAECGTETAAALRLGISQPAVTQALQELERLAGCRLFQRTQRMVMTPAGLALVEQARLARDLAASVNALAVEPPADAEGRLTVGALSLSGTQLVSGAIEGATRACPGVRVAMLEGAYGDLLQDLRHGRIDVMVGTLHPYPPAEVVMSPLFDDSLVVVARPHHPWADRPLSLDSLAHADWVLPFRRGASPNVVECALADAGFVLPHSTVEVAGMAMLRGVLWATDRLSVMWLSQARLEVEEGCLVILPVALPGASRPMGFYTLADQVPSTALQAFVFHMHARMAAATPALAELDIGVADEMTALLATMHSTGGAKQNAAVAAALA